MIQKNLRSYAILSLVVALVSACGNPAQDPAAQLAALKDQKAQIEQQIAELEKQVAPPAPRIRTVGLEELKPESFRHYIDLQGKVDAEESVMATAKMPGSLQKVYVKNGDVVKKGQLLAEVDASVLRKNMAELEGQLATATDIYNRQKGLWDQKIGTEVALIQAKTAKESLERSIETLKEQMNMTRIYAPTAGTVDMVLLKQGQAIAPGMPLCNIMNLSNLKIVGNVTEAYTAKVKKGDLVQVYFPDMDKEISTRVSFVSKTINPTTRTFSVECALKGSGYRANQVAVMKIIDYQNSKAIVVPVNLIQVAQDGDFVLVAEKSEGNKATVKKVNIKQGQNYGGFVEILDGLKPGDWIVSTGFQDVNTGEVVAF
ncbi:MAG: efflux RND transporter periplasmic adaptor subunit [Saprospiraceae bacterium]|nr:efflux RND transporter periplasmic adaptor subunit [Saprospiraceae bacterium]MCB9343072.1 efflux RND transporter periplasmic adaptor subunit [Lewinellaceae bacterium]